MLRGKGHLQCARFACRNADQLLLEPRNEGVGANEHDCVVARAAFKRFAVNGAGE
jgi:hypothetical protein